MHLVTSMMTFNSCDSPARSASHSHRSIRYSKAAARRGHLASAPPPMPISSRIAMGYLVSHLPRQSRIRFAQLIVVLKFLLLVALKPRRMLIAAFFVSFAVLLGHIDSAV